MHGVQAGRARGQRVVQNGDPATKDLHAHPGDGVILGTQSHADYPAPEKGGRPDMAPSFRKITRQCSDRIARRAFELAMKRRSKVTAIHKANSFHMADGLFLECVRNVAMEFPEVALDDLLVDASTAHLVRTPERFDVIVATNFYGDILSDLANELSGSLGLAGSIMASDALCCAQAQHGSAPDIAGRDRANPTSMILSVAMLLQWMGDHHKSGPLRDAGDAMEAAVDRVLADPASRTRDLGGTLGCDAFRGRVVEAVA
jgi:3-isopropylmalate dehydrogenase